MKKLNLISTTSSMQFFNYVLKENMANSDKNKMLPKRADKEA